MHPRTMAGKDPDNGLELTADVKKWDSIEGELGHAHPREPWVVFFYGVEDPVQVLNYESEQQLTFKPSDVDRRVLGAKFIGEKDLAVLLDAPVCEINSNKGPSLIVYRITEDFRMEHSKTFQVMKCLSAVTLTVHPYVRHVLVAGSGYSGEGVINFWDLDRDFHSKTGGVEGPIYWTCFRTAEPYIFLCGASNTVMVWDAKKMVPLQTWKPTWTPGICPTSVGLGPRHQESLIIAGDGEGRLHVWDYQRENCVTTLKAHEGRVVSVYFHPHLPYIFSTSRDGEIKVWSDSNYQCIRSLRSGLTHVFYAFPGRNESMLVLWDYLEDEVCVIKIGMSPKADFEERGKSEVGDGREESDEKLQIEKMEESRIIHLETELGAVRAENMALEDELQKQTQTHAQRIKELETELINIKMERQELREVFEMLRSEHDREKGMHSERIKQLENENGNLLVEREALKERLEESKAKVQHSQCRLEMDGGAAERLETMRMERRALEEGFQKERQTYAERVKELETELRNGRIERQALGKAFERFQSEHEREKGMHLERVKQLQNDISNVRAERGVVKQRLDRSGEVTKEVLMVDQHPFREFSLDELKSATNDFSNNCKLEERHYGCVYMGRITPVTVKRLEGGNSLTPNQHAELTTEVVDALRSLRHPHLQCLVGVCYGGNCLVYEPMANGNVKEWISSAEGPQRGFLPWYIRLRIMAQVAQALAFLHSSSSLSVCPIIHRAIKPENILLGTNNLVAKLAEVDAALIAPVDGAPRMPISPRVDAQYMAPEFFRTEVFTQQTDIYAFGITILEILTGKFKDAFGIMEDAVEDPANFTNTLDPNAGSWDVDLAMEAAAVGLRCANPNRRLRPSMMTGEGAILPALERIAQQVQLADSIEDVRRMSLCE
ncbi:hypothetical protein CBR_g42103 [Chara braunii]|uniref:Protein kinase domain-containing protein n=1 Tax=Chara braunii TaxID=69332 RepID=A0A388LWW6_CHABU|nr:hypothetical protein CBR_g42103 [Chara braunii]|eukprot:GBG86820.1 hypothetical protein CBR_g42103 [Chara braunii]